MNGNILTSYPKMKRPDKICCGMLQDDIKPQGINEPIIYTRYCSKCKRIIQKFKAVGDKFLKVMFKDGDKFNQ